MSDLFSCVRIFILQVQPILLRFIILVGLFDGLRFCIFVLSMRFSLRFMIGFCCMYYDLIGHFRIVFVVIWVCFMFRYSFSGIRILSFLLIWSPIKIADIWSKTKLLFYHMHLSISPHFESTFRYFQLYCYSWLLFVNFLLFWFQGWLTQYCMFSIELPF